MRKLALFGAAIVVVSLVSPGGNPGRCGEAALAAAAPDLDRTAFWPDDRHPTELVACVAGGSAGARLQRTRLADGTVDTIVRGLAACGPVRRTAWGTIVFAEAPDDASGDAALGRVYELLHPSKTRDVSLASAADAFTGGQGAGNLAVRGALGRGSFAQLSIYPSGLSYYGSGGGRPAPASAVFKFVPSAPWAGTRPIQTLSESPLARGRVYGLRLAQEVPRRDVPSGLEDGETEAGAWIPIRRSAASDLSAESERLGLSTRAHPEAMEIDWLAEALGKVRFCGNLSAGRRPGDAPEPRVCLSDGSLAEALAGTASPTLERLRGLPHGDPRAG